MHNLVFASTADLAAAIRTGQISAVEALQAYLAQIARHNPTLNAVITLDAERAAVRAQEADAALRRGELWGPLHGVPFTLKDAHATAGMRTTTGFPPLDHVPQADGTVAARLTAAGGVLMGKTNVPVMLADVQTTNPIFGRTANPWDIARTCGGSSGGAAAAVAAGITPFEIGTDLSGSIRIPAAYCGVFGLKPTEHRVSLAGLIPGLPPVPSVRIMSCIGPLARTVEDLGLLYRIIAGPDGCDTDVPPVPAPEVPALALPGLRIAYAPTFPGVPVAAAIREAIADVAERLQRAGAIVAAPPLPTADIQATLARAGALLRMVVGAFQVDAHEAPTSLAAYLEALHWRDEELRAWEQFFTTWDALLCPASMITAFPHCAPGAPLHVDGAAAPYELVSAHSFLFNYTGHPAVTLPVARDGAGLPIGVQLVGKRWDESRLLGMAAALVDVTGPFQAPPG
ncbi:MAG TPA: amidase family protein, partial [Longimicrobium sp.]